MTNQIQPDPAGALVPRTARQLVQEYRTRTTLTLNVRTLQRLDDLVVKYTTTRGPLIDKMVFILWTAVTTGKVICCTGPTCMANRTDIPEVF